MIVPLYIEYIDSIPLLFQVIFINEGIGSDFCYQDFRSFTSYDSAKDFYTKLQRGCIRDLMDFQPESKDL